MSDAVFDEELNSTGESRTGSLGEASINNTPLDLDQEGIELDDLEPEDMADISQETGVTTQTAKMQAQLNKD